MASFRDLFSKPEKSAGGSTIEKYTPTSNPAPLGFSSAPAEWQTLRENHYEKWFGHPENAIVWHESVPLIPHVDIHIIPPSRESGRNFVTLITSGMSDEKMTLPVGIGPQYARAEIIFYIASDETKAYQIDKPWYIEAMFFYAHFPFMYKTWLAYSHTLPNGNPAAPLVEGSALTTALFLPPIFEPEEFTQGLKLGNDSVNFLWLTFLSDRETQFKLDYGDHRLIEKFNRDNMPQVFNPFRPPIV